MRAGVVHVHRYMGLLVPITRPDRPGDSTTYIYVWNGIACAVAARGMCLFVQMLGKRHFKLLQGFRMFFLYMDEIMIVKKPSIPRIIYLNSIPIHLSPFYISLHQTSRTAQHRFAYDVYISPAHHITHPPLSSSNYSPRPLLW